MSQDHGISKCLGDALYRRGGEEGERESGFILEYIYYNIKFNMSRGQCGGQGTALWGLILSSHFYVSSRDQTQPAVCWTQLPKSTSVLSTRTGPFP